MDFIEYNSSPSKTGKSFKWPAILVDFFKSHHFHGGPSDFMKGPGFTGKMHKRPISAKPLDQAVAQAQSPLAPAVQAPHILLPPNLHLDAQHSDIQEQRMPSVISWDDYCFPWMSTRSIRRHNLDYPSEFGVVAELQRCMLEQFKGRAVCLVNNPYLTLYPVSIKLDGMAIVPSVGWDPAHGKFVGDTNPENPKTLQDLENGKRFNCSTIRDTMITEGGVIVVTSLCKKAENIVGSTCWTKRKSAEGALRLGKTVAKVVSWCKECVKHHQKTNDSMVLQQKQEGDGCIRNECTVCNIKTQDMMRQRAQWLTKKESERGPFPGVSKACTTCQRLGEKFAEPSLRSCVRCRKKRQQDPSHKCERCCAFVEDQDSEATQHSAMQQNLGHVKDGNLDIELSLMSMIPDMPHVAKRVVRGLTDWFWIFEHKSEDSEAEREERKEERRAERGSGPREWFSTRPVAPAIFEDPVYKPSVVKEGTTSNGAYRSDMQSLAELMQLLQMWKHVKDAGMVFFDIVPEWLRPWPGNSADLFQKIVLTCFADSAIFFVDQKTNKKTMETSHALYHIRNPHSPMTPEPAPLPNGCKVRDLCFSGGVLWIATDEGLYYLEVEPIIRNEVHSLLLPELVRQLQDLNVDTEGLRVEGLKFALWHAKIQEPIPRFLPEMMNLDRLVVECQNALPSIPTKHTINGKVKNRPVTELREDLTKYMVVTEDEKRKAEITVTATKEVMAAAPVQLTAAPGIAAITSYAKEKCFYVFTLERDGLVTECKVCVHNGKLETTVANVLQLPISDSGWEDIAFASKPDMQVLHVVSKDLGAFVIQRPSHTRLWTYTHLHKTDDANDVHFHPEGVCCARDGTAYYSVSSPGNFVGLLCSDGFSLRPLAGSSTSVIANGSAKSASFEAIACLDCQDQNLLIVDAGILRLGTPTELGGECMRLTHAFCKCFGMKNANGQGGLPTGSLSELRSHVRNLLDFLRQAFCYSKQQSGDYGCASRELYESLVLLEESFAFLSACLDYFDYESFHPRSAVQCSSEHIHSLIRGCFDGGMCTALELLRILMNLVEEQTKEVVDCGFPYFRGKCREYYQKPDSQMSIVYNDLARPNLKKQKVQPLSREQRELIRKSIFPMKRVAQVPTRSKTCLRAPGTVQAGLYNPHPSPEEKAQVRPLSSSLSACLVFVEVGTLPFVQRAPFQTQLTPAVIFGDQFNFVGSNGQTEVDDLKIETEVELVVLLRIAISSEVNFERRDEIAVQYCPEKDVFKVNQERYTSAVRSCIELRRSYHETSSDEESCEDHRDSEGEADTDEGDSEAEYNLSVRLVKMPKRRPKKISYGNMPRTSNFLQRRYESRAQRQ